MLKSEAKKHYQREYMKKRRSNKGSNILPLETDGSNTPDIILKLIDPFWRGRLAKICDAFEHSHNPRYKEEVWLGETNLSTACDYLECTG